MTRHSTELAELRSITRVRIGTVRFRPKDDEHPDAWVAVVHTPDGVVPMFITPKVLGHSSNLTWLLRRHGRPRSLPRLTAEDRRRIRALLRAITAVLHV